MLAEAVGPAPGVRMEMPVGDDEVRPVLLDPLQQRLHAVEGVAGERRPDRLVAVDCGEEPARRLGQERRLRRFQIGRHQHAVDLQGRVGIGLLRRRPKRGFELIELGHFVPSCPLRRK